MYARLAAFEGGDTERMRDQGEARMASGSPFPDGVRRALLLGTPDGSRRLFITFFDTKEELAAAEEGFEKMGDEVPEEIRGQRVAVEVYDVLVDWPE
jgi:hypothetical protein